ncbi:hypothetical protein MJ588_13735 [Klebsiella pneumoniae]|nr:hypothetical protein MJ588_13735 [Klebsiella pneumoniae]
MGNRVQAIIAGTTSLFTQRQGDGNNVFGEKMFRIENNYERRKRSANSSEDLVGKSIIFGHYADKRRNNPTDELLRY